MKTRPFAMLALFFVFPCLALGDARCTSIRNRATTVMTAFPRRRRCGPLPLPRRRRERAMRLCFKAGRLFCPQREAILSWDGRSTDCVSRRQDRQRSGCRHCRGADHPPWLKRRGRLRMQESGSIAFHMWRILGRGYPSRVLYSGTDLFPYDSLEHLRTFVAQGTTPGPRHGFFYDAEGPTCSIVSAPCLGPLRTQRPQPARDGGLAPRREIA